MNYLLAALFLASSTSVLLAQVQETEDTQQIKTILQAQEQAWNKGNLEGFMNGYLPTEDLVFIGSKGLNHGWKKTLSNYKSSYPDQATMGRLTFTILEMKPLGKDFMLVLGKWHLSREIKGDAEGYFSLTWQKIKGQWLIIADHSS